MALRTIKPSRGPERRDAVEQRVFDAVETLLDDGHRFAELSVATIADAAGMARSTFYVHFSDKTELLIRLAQTATSDIVAEGERWLAAGASSVRADPASITATMRRVIAVYRRHESIFDAVLAATGYDPLVAEFWRRHIEVLFLSGSRSLRRAQELGALDESVDVDSLARMAAWSIERTVSMHVADQPSSTDERLARTMGRSLWLMVFGTAPPDAPGSADAKDSIDGDAAGAAPYDGPDVPTRDGSGASDRRQRPGQPRA